MTKSLLNFDFTMRVLLGTPIHESKDYAMDKWIASVSKFDYPFDLLMVDNSGNIKYVDRLHEYWNISILTMMRYLMKSLPNQEKLYDERYWIRVMMPGSHLSVM